MVVELRVQLETQLNDSRPVWIQDIETDSHGDLYLLDSKFCRVLKYDPKGEFLLSIGKYGTGEKEFIRPDDIIIDSNDLLYVLDGPQKKICKYSHEGRFLERIQIDLKGAGMTLQGAAGPDGEIVLAGYKGGSVFHILDASGRLSRSLGAAFRPNYLLPDEWRLESTFIALSQFYCKGILYCTHPFRYEVAQFEYATGKALPGITLNFPRWRDAELRQGGIIIHTAAVKTLIDSQGNIFNVLAIYHPGKQTELLLDIANKNGSKIALAQQLKFEAMAMDRNDRFYLISNGPPLSLSRVKFNFR
jgi:hypothetical protein